jgi:hypothetical protein
VGNETQAPKAIGEPLFWSPTDGKLQNQRVGVYSEVHGCETNGLPLRVCSAHPISELPNIGKRALQVLQMTLIRHRLSERQVDTLLEF